MELGEGRILAAESCRGIGVDPNWLTDGLDEKHSISLIHHSLSPVSTNTIPKVQLLTRPATLFLQYPSLDILRFEPTMAPAGRLEALRGRGDSHYH